MNFLPPRRNGQAKGQKRLTKRGGPDRISYGVGIHVTFTDQYAFYGGNSGRRKCGIGNLTPLDHGGDGSRLARVTLNRKLGDVTITKLFRLLVVAALYGNSRQVSRSHGVGGLDGEIPRPDKRARRVGCGGDVFDTSVPDVPKLLKGQVPGQFKRSPVLADIGAVGPREDTDSFLRERHFNVVLDETSPAPYSSGGHVSPWGGFLAQLDLAKCSNSWHCHLPPPGVDRPLAEFLSLIF